MFLLQLDGSQKLNIPNTRLGFVVIQSPLDFEELNAIGQTYYILNISATVSLECICKYSSPLLIRPLPPKATHINRAPKATPITNQMSDTLK
jgi:hypothetical protein